MAKVSQTVKNITDSLDEEDIEKVWEYLGKTFGFNIGEWEKEFSASVQPLPRNTSIQEAFMLFGKKRIEPVLNEILKRRQHPTWIGLLTFVLKDKIAGSKKRDDQYKERYN